MGPGMAAVMATMRAVGLGRREECPGEGVGVGDRGSAARRRQPESVPVRHGGRPVLLGCTLKSWSRWISSSSAGRVAPALLGEDVDDDGAVPFGRVGQGLFHAGDVVAVDGPGVADAEGLEERWGVTTSRTALARPWTPE